MLRHIWLAPIYYSVAHAYSLLQLVMTYWTCLAANRIVNHASPWMLEMVEERVFNKLINFTHVLNVSHRVDHSHQRADNSHKKLLAAPKTLYDCRLFLKLKLKTAEIGRRFLIILLTVTFKNGRVAQWRSACPRTKRSAVQDSTTASGCADELFTYI